MIESPIHVGLPRGRNIGIRACRAPIIAFTDADCVPDRDWLERGIERMEHDGADILAGGITIPIDHDDSTAAFVDSATYLDQERYARRGFGAGANLWVRRDVFERAGYFNEELEAYGGDEEDLCHRAVANGARLVYAPEAPCGIRPGAACGISCARHTASDTASPHTVATTPGRSGSIPACSFSGAPIRPVVGSTTSIGHGRNSPAASVFGVSPRCTRFNTSASNCRSHSET